MTPSRQDGAQSTPDDRSADRIESDLKRTRAELGETLEVLGERLDVKTRAKGWAKDTAERSQRQVKTIVDERGRELGIAGGALALTALTFLVRRGRDR